MVASEVRSITQRWASAAQEIKTLIGCSVAKVNIGSGSMRQAGATIKEAVQCVRPVIGTTAEIIAANNEQSAGIEKISQAVIVDVETQPNATLAEQAAEVVSSLQDRAMDLSRALGNFKLDMKE